MICSSWFRVFGYLENTKPLELRL